MATALPTLPEFIAQLPQTEEIPIVLGDTSVILAALIVGAKISLVVTGTENPQLTDAATIGANVQSFLKLKEWCEKKSITMPATDITEIVGGFEVNNQISLDSAVIPFQVELSYIRAESKKAASFAVLVCALASKPIDETSIIIEAFKLQKHGLAPLVNAAITLSPKFDPAVAAYDPFSRNVVSPFPPRSVMPSPVPFLIAVKTNQAVPPSAEVAPEQHIEEENEEEEPIVQEQPFTEVVSKKKVREFFGASGSPPKSMPAGAVYNPRVKGKIAAWTSFKEGGIARDRKLTEIFGDWIKFVLQNHDQFKDGSREGFRSYLEHQLGDDYATLKHLIPV